MAKQTKRVKSDRSIIPVEGWRAADGLLRKVGDLQLEIEAAQAVAKVDADKAKAILAETVDPLKEEIKKITRSLEAFAVNNRNDFSGAKSKKLGFGRIGWRKSTSIGTKKDTLELIKEMLRGAKKMMCITIKESVSKDGLAKLTDEELAAVGARWKVKDDFFVEPELPQAAEH
jgi:phage host-nuclease inhibitor protein Gam